MDFERARQRCCAAAGGSSLLARGRAADRRDLRGVAEGRRPRGRVRPLRRRDLVLDRRRVRLQRVLRSAPTRCCSAACSAARADDGPRAPDLPARRSRSRWPASRPPRSSRRRGAGGVALTYWALRKAGMERRRAACRMVAFLALLYSVYLLAIVIFGVLLRTGVLPGDDPLGGTIVPAAIAGVGDAPARAVALMPGDFERAHRASLEAARRARRQDRERLAKVPATLAPGRAHRDRPPAPPELQARRSRRRSASGRATSAILWAASTRSASRCRSASSSRASSSGWWRTSRRRRRRVRDRWTPG